MHENLRRLNPKHFSGASLSRTSMDSPRSRFDPRFGAMVKYMLLSGFARAVSSAVEHCLHTAGVTGSIPVSPTMEPRGCTQVKTLFFCLLFAASRTMWRIFAYDYGL